MFFPYAPERDRPETGESLARIEGIEQGHGLRGVLLSKSAIAVAINPLGDLGSIFAIFASTSGRALPLPWALNDARSS